MTYLAKWEHIFYSCNDHVGVSSVEKQDSSLHKKGKFFIPHWNWGNLPLLNRSTNCILGVMVLFDNR